MERLVTTTTNPSATLDSRRNIAIMAHIDAGKTTLSERMLWKSGAIRKPGEVHDGDTTMDNMQLERERGITISSAAISFAWKSWQFALVDTPGHVDFSMEVERSMRAVDGAVLALCAVSGAQTQTESVWRRAAKAGIPAIIVVNKMDREGADFDRAVSSAREKLGANALAVALPLGAGGSFSGAVDLVGMRAILWSRDGEMSTRDLDAGELEWAAVKRFALVEQLGESGSDQALAWFVDGTRPSEQELWAAIRAACSARQVSPVIPASAFKNQGVEMALDLAGMCLPSPSERGFSSEGEFSALVFKTEASSSGQRVYARVASGSLDKAGTFEVARGGALSNASRMGRPMSDGAQAIDRAIAGDVVVFEGLRQAKTGDTLRARGSNIELESIKALEPVVGWRVEAANKSELSKVLEGLGKLCADDPSLRLSTGDGGEAVLWGQGDLHLEVALERLAREFGAVAKPGAPEVAYAYRLSGESGVAVGSVDKQNGGKGQYAKVELSIEPSDTAEFSSGLVGEAVPRKFVPAIERGVRAAMAEAGDGGHPVLGWRAVLVGGQAHAVDSSELAFERAGFEAAKVACAQAGLELMEPMGKIASELPSALVGAVAQEVAKRGGKVLSVSEGPMGADVVARAPMSKLFGFVASLRSATAGRAQARIEPDGYEPQRPGSASAPRMR